jgi:hypothetical protein
VTIRHCRLDLAFLLLIPHLVRSDNGEMAVNPRHSGETPPSQRTRSKVGNSRGPWVWPYLLGFCVGNAIWLPVTNHYEWQPRLVLALLVGPAVALILRFFRRPVTVRSVIAGIAGALTWPVLFFVGLVLYGANWD